MTDFAALLGPDRGQKARPIHLVDKNSFDAWAEGPPGRGPRVARGAPIRRKEGLRLRPAAARRRFRSGERGRERWTRSRPGASPRSASGCPKAPTSSPSGEPGKAALGWLLAQHRFDAYRSKPEPDRGPRVLVTGEAASIDQTIRLAEATALVRDLVDTPAADLGPAELEQAVARGSRPIGRARPRDHGRRSGERISADRRRRRGRHA